MLGRSSTCTRSTRITRQTDIATGSARLSILFLTAFFIIGGTLLSAVDVDTARASRNDWSLDEAPPSQEHKAGNASP